MQTKWKLKKCVYGLADASLYWYNKVKEIMLGTGGNMSQVDPAVFYWQDKQFKGTKCDLNFTARCRSSGLRATKTKLAKGYTPLFPLASPSLSVRSSSSTCLFSEALSIRDETAD